MLDLLASAVDVVIYAVAVVGVVAGGARALPMIENLFCYLTAGSETAD